MGRASHARPHIRACQRISSATGAPSARRKRAGLGYALHKAAKELARAQDSERRARDETAELRGQIKATDHNAKK
jgi:hypothetical protein